MKLERVAWFLLVCALFLNACNLPAAPAGTPTGSAGVLTAVGVTVDALRTQQALQTPSGAPGTPVPATDTPIPPTPQPGVTNASPSPTNTVQNCDLALFIQDVSVPDGSKFGPGQVFTKTWRLKNIGTCAWNKNYALVFTNGDALGAPASVNLPGDVSPGDTVDLSVEMKAPLALTKYTGWWKLRNAAGVQFEAPFYVLIEVIASTLTPTLTVTPGPSQTVSPSGLVYDFAANACLAEWLSAGGALPCPGKSDDTRGFVQVPVGPVLETGATEINPVLLTYPEMKDNGAITGTFPAITIQSGYHFRATLGCLNNTPSCKVKFQLNFREGSATPENLGQWDQIYDNSIQGVDVDLSRLAGRSVQLILVVLADGPATEDQAVWINPRLIK